MNLGSLLKYFDLKVFLALHIIHLYFHHFIDQPHFHYTIAYYLTQAGCLGAFKYLLPLSVAASAKTVRFEFSF